MQYNHDNLNFNIFVSSILSELIGSSISVLLNTWRRV